MRGFIAGMVSFVALVVAPIAGAATIDYQAAASRDRPETWKFIAHPGEANRLLVSDSVNGIRFEDAGALALLVTPMALAQGCRPVPALTVTCRPLDITVDLGDGHDRFAMRSTRFAYDVFDGAGDDIIDAPGGTFFAGEGADTYLGAGTVDYSRRTGPVYVTLDGVANDGVAGEGDFVAPHDDRGVYGTSQGGDILIASDRGDFLSGLSDGSGDTVTGGAGADSLYSTGLADGGDGDDLITGEVRALGGSGADQVFGGGLLDGGPGDDLVDGIVTQGLILGGDGDDNLRHVDGRAIPGPGEDRVEFNRFGPRPAEVPEADLRDGERDTVADCGRTDLPIRIFFDVFDVVDLRRPARGCDNAEIIIE